MNQTDWVGGVEQRSFKDIRNTRPTVAEEKAQLALQLGLLINKVPQGINAASVDAVRRWKLARESAEKVAKNKRASVQELTSAIEAMRRFK